MKQTTNYTTTNGDNFYLEKDKERLIIVTDEGNGDSYCITLTGQEEVDEFIKAIQTEFSKF
jgi:hypothetical protein